MRNIRVGLTLEPETVKIMDDTANELRISRAQFVSIAMREYVEVRKEIAKIKNLTIQQLIEKGKEITDR